MKYFKNLKPVTVIVILLLIAAGFSGCGNDNTVKDKRVRNVKAVAAGYSSINIYVEYSGKLKPVEEVVISSKAPGKVEGVNADIGSEVKKGDILFTLESKDAEAQKRQAQASLEAARANYTRTAESSIEQQVLQAEASVKQAQVQYNDAMDMYDKTEDLYKEGQTSKQEFDNVKSRLDNATIQLDTAQKNLELIKGKAAKQSANAAFAQVGQAEAAVQLSAIQLDNTRIASPVSGVVSVRNIDVGEMVAAGSPVYTVINTDVLILEISITDKMLGRLSKGEKVGLKVNAVEGKEFEGNIDSISPAADSKTQLYTVKIRIDNKNLELKPGMFAKVSLPVEKKDSILTVPEECIVVESGVQYAYTVVGENVKRAPVETGISDGKTIEVINGLKSGDRVITEGQIFLHDGEKVKIVK
ncbi:MAG: efflux RND transporter periplasmic adaptor subunit [Clostridia bacterium]|nr:efflux RND transporter periplasmic adaptor subunit [Clostridia bacterium]